MNVEDFVKKYNGKKVDFDGAYGAQCVDLFRQYNKEVWKNPRTEPVEGAKDIFLNYEKMPIEKKYLEIKKIPIIGDVVVWNSTEKNQYGHVAIVLGVIGVNSLIVFEQDGFVQDGAKINIRDTNNILGFLRKK